MKRVSTLVGGILGTVAQSLLSIIFVLSFAMLATQVSLAISMQDAVAMEGSAMLVLCGIITLASIASILMNSIAISAWKKDKEDFSKKKGCIIAGIVLNFILIIFVILMLTAMAVDSAIAILIIAIVLLFVANVLYIVDLCKEKKRVEPEVVGCQEVEVNASYISSEFEKVYALKKKSIITDEEYKLLKKHFIKVFTK